MTKPSRPYFEKRSVWSTNNRSSRVYDFGGGGSCFFRPTCRTFPIHSIPCPSLPFLSTPSEPFSLSLPIYSLLSASLTAIEPIFMYQSDIVPLFRLFVSLDMSLHCLPLATVTFLLMLLLSGRGTSATSCRFPVQVSCRHRFTCGVVGQLCRAGFQFAGRTRSALIRSRLGLASRSQWEYDGV
jgi:hypothetical protein